MFLLVSVPHVGAHPGEHQHDVSVQISTSLGKTVLPISRIRNIPLTWILARVFPYLPPFISQILDFIYSTVLIFTLIYFKWRDNENQRLIISKKIIRRCMEKYSLLSKLAKCTLNMALKLTFSVFLFFFVFWLHFRPPRHC